jgi:processive 1,2-diacylglycerol beta-glucosyltransferase
MIPPSAQGKKVLLMSASAGSGHIRAAEALVTAFSEDPRVGEVLHVDSLQFTNKLFRDFYSKLYISMVKSAPTVLGAFYNASDEPWKMESIRLAMDRLNTGKLVKFVKEFEPDYTVCTHFMPAGIMAHLIDEGLLNTHLSIVVTDFDCHAMWLSRAFHRYFVALEETKVHLEALGLPGERVTVSGIPTDRAFAKPINRESVCREYGLDCAKRILLMSAGTFGVGPAEYVVSRLRQLQHEAQIVVTCGRSDDLRERVSGIVNGDERFRVLGYCDRYHELMHLADLFIGKPGGLTTAEALVCELPMVIFSPIPGQEERNSDHLLEEGIAIRCNNLTTIAFKVDQLLADPDRLTSMRANARRLARPDACKDIVNTLLHDHVPPVQLDAETREAMTVAALKP